jgi:hypothetical protein
MIFLRVSGLSLWVMGLSQWSEISSSPAGSYRSKPRAAENRTATLLPGGLNRCRYDRSLRAVRSAMITLPDGKGRTMGWVDPCRNVFW